MKRRRFLVEDFGRAGRVKEVVLCGHICRAAHHVANVYGSWPFNGLCPTGVLVELVDDVLHPHVLISYETHSVITLDSLTDQDITYLSIYPCHVAPALAMRLEQTKQG